MKKDEVLRLVRVRFPSQVRPGEFLTGNIPIEYGMRVVAMSDRGLTVGYVNSQIYEVPYTKDMGVIPYIQGIATDDDVVKYKAAYQKQRQAMDVFKELVEEHKLPMTLEDMELTDCSKKYIFYYTAPTRIDFRALLKDLIGKLKSKIELRQIVDGNVRKSEGMPCSPDLCDLVNSVIGDGTSSRKCSESFCCLEENDPFYEDKRSRLPKKYTIIETHTGEVGKVLHLDYVKEEFEILTDQGVMKRYTSDLYKGNANKKRSAFTKKFDEISYQNKTVIGLEKRLHKEEEEREQDTKRSDELAKEFSEEVWRNINIIKGP